MARGRKGSGVQVRENDIRVRFTWRDKRHAIALDIAPTIPNRKVAERLMVDVRAAMKEGTFSFARFFPSSPEAHIERDASGEASPNTYKTIAKRWRDSRSELSHGQRDKDRLAVEFWRPIVGSDDKDLSIIVPSELKAKIGALPWAGAKYRNNMLSALRGMFDMWVADDPRNRFSPVLAVKNQRVQKTKPDPYTPDEVAAIMADMEARYDERVVCYYGIAFFSGLRPEEEIVLRWASIDERRRIGRIERALYRGIEKSVKNYEVRDVEFNDAAWAYVMRMKKWTAMKGETGHGCVLENPRTAAPWASEADQRDLYFNPTIKRLRIRHRSAYKTRSTCASMMLLAGQDPSYCARQLGHSLKVFWEKYADWINTKRNDEERAKFNRMLARMAEEAKGRAA